MSSGVDVNSLPDHRDPYFEAWPAEGGGPRTSQGFRQHIGRTRFHHSKTNTRHAANAGMNVGNESH
jgi:hypothetical protein